jgi:hypothetical protein
MGIVLNVVLTPSSLLTSPSPFAMMGMHQFQLIMPCYSSSNLLSLIILNPLTMYLNKQTVNLSNALYMQLKPTGTCNRDVLVSKTHKHFVIHINMPRNPLTLIYNSLFLHISNYI